MDKQVSTQRKDEGRIFFENWKLRVEGTLFSQQFDHLTCTLRVEGELPQGWEWVVMMEKGDGEYLNYLLPEVADSGLELVLTADQLAVSGWYKLQLKGEKGEKIRHTNIVHIYVEASLSGDKQWPVIPSEFSDMERRISEKVKQVEGYSTHLPVIGENGNWWAWEGGNYVDSGRPSQGERGEKGDGGYTPQKGVDYFTESDKEEIVNDVLNALPNGDEVSY